MTVIKYILMAFWYFFSAVLTIMSVMMGSITIGHAFKNYYNVDDMIGVGIAFFIFTFVMSVIISLIQDNKGK